MKRQNSSLDDTVILNDTQQDCKEFQWTITITAGFLGI
jgi:hypothetical protein